VVTPAGRLPLALSDASASTMGGRILIAGGEGSTGRTQSSIIVLEPGPALATG
jgi:hypothetical protein